MPAPTPVFHQGGSILHLYVSARVTPHDPGPSHGNHEFLDKFAPGIEAVCSIFPDRVESEALQRVAFERNHVENLSGQIFTKRNAAKHVADNRNRDVISVLPSHVSISLLVPLSIRPSQYRIAQRDFSQLGESAECTSFTVRIIDILRSSRFSRSGHVATRRSTNATEMTPRGVWWLDPCVCSRLSKRSVK